MPSYDIAIIGAGMVGLSLALALKPSLAAGHRLVLIDPAPQPSDRAPQSPSFDDRATALADYSCRALAELGIWAHLAEHASPIDWIEVSDRGLPGYQVLDSQRLLGQAFGAVVSNANLGQALWQAAQTLPSVDWRFGTRVATVESHTAHQTLVLSDDQTLSARQVFLCDGGRSPLLRKLGIGVRHQPYQAMARIATVRTEQPHQGRAFERFTDQGPIALLPFGEYCALVWTYPERLDKRLSTLSETQQLDWLNEAFGQRLGRILQISATQAYPLSLMQAVHPLRHRLMAVGNSATTLHPVAGQGFNLAMRSLMRTARHCNQCLANGDDPGDYQGLQALFAAIEADQRQTALLSDQLVRRFTSTNPLTRLARTLALGSLDRHPLAQQAFALTSMGLVHGAPLSVSPTVETAI
ncbi:MAG: FAD-dependent monooxygenase [Saccharospirillum sp.]